MGYGKCQQVRDIYPKLKNPDKYIGTRPVSTRSSWEYRFAMLFLDNNERVVSWNSEDVVIPYLFELDGKKHRYFVDFYFKRDDGKEFLVEIKPYDQTLPPKAQKRKTKRLLNELKTFTKNKNKWDATKKVCSNLRKSGRDISFVIITEKDLF